MKNKLKMFFMFYVFTIAFFIFSHAGEVFVKIKKIESEKISKATILPGGNVIYFWEQTRPPTDKEKIFRKEWFDKEWETFINEAKSKGIPEIDKESEKFAKEIEKEVYQKPVINSLESFFYAAIKGIPIIVYEALKIGYPLARNYFINQPVVVKAGFKLYSPNGQKIDIPWDIEKFYGKETWMRIPLEEINMIASPNGKFLVLETREEFLVLFEIKDNTVIPIAQIYGKSPIGWSRDDSLMFVTKPSKSKKCTFSVYSIDDLQHEVANLGPVISYPSKKFSWITSVAISKEFLAVGGANIFCIYSLPDGTVRQPDKKTFHRIGGSPDGIIYGLSFSEDGKLLYIASGRGFFVIDPYTFSVLDEYIRPATANFSFHMLASVSPDGKYAAILHGKERDYGLSTLFIWDIHNKKIVQKIGTEKEKMLQSISSGFSFIYPPATLTNDWKFLLTIRQDGVLELFQNQTL